MGDIDGLIYPLLSSSSSHFRRASSSLGGNGYSLQSIVSGASGFRVIAWSHGREGGSFFDSTGSNMFACLQYSSGTSTSFVNLPASLDNSIEIPLREDSLSSSLKMVSSRRCRVRNRRPRMIRAITSLIRDFLQSTDRIMIGRKDVSIEASLHLNFGSKVESQG